MEIITSTPPHSTKSQNKRKKTINWVLGGGDIIPEQDEDADCTFIQGGRCPHSKGQMSLPSYKLDTIFYVGDKQSLP